MINTRHVALLAIPGLSICLVCLTRSTMSDTSPGHAPADGASIPAPGTQAALRHREFSRYAAGIRANLFFAPATPAVLPPKSHAIQSPQVAPATPPASPAPPSAPAEDALAGYVYTGTVTIDGQLWALVENRKSGWGGYVSAGDAFAGFTVTAVSPSAVTMTLEGTTRTLFKNEDYSLTPLDKSAKHADKEQVAKIPAPEGYLAVGTSFAVEAKQAISIWLAGTGNTAHLKDDVFEGRMSPEEYDQRVHQESSVELLSGRIMHVRYYSRAGSTPVE